MEIVDELKKIIKDKFEIEINDIYIDLLGNEINLKPVELAIFLKVLEEKYDIVFSKQDIINGSFNNIINISRLVQKESDESN